MPASELSQLITKRRMNWFLSHIKGIFEDQDNLKPEEWAYKIILLNHMRINPEHSKIVRISPTKIKIESYNFCPYLEACDRLGLDTRKICKEIGEPSIQRVCEMVNPNLKFSRNYDNIRPYNPHFCEEYIELVL